MSSVTHPANDRDPMDRSIHQRAIHLPWVTERFMQKNVEMTPGQIIAEGERLPPSNRLVVLVPDSNIDLNELAKRIWLLAAPDHRDVLYLSSPKIMEDEYRARRNLTTLAALTRYPSVKVQTMVVVGENPVKMALENSHPDDILVCFDEDLAAGLGKQRKLAELLASRTRLPVYVLRGAYPKEGSPNPRVFLNVLLLMICLATIAAFFGAQVWLDHNLVGVPKIGLEMAAVFLEVGIIGFCATRSNG